MVREKLFTPSGDSTSVVAYHDVGDSELPIVLLHGFACGRAMWRHQVEAFARGRRVISFDFPAHGASRCPDLRGTLTEDGLADLTVELLGELKVPRAILVGFSMGGGVALNVALRHPSAVAGLFLADVGGGSVDPVRHRAAMAALAGELQRGGIEAFVDIMLESPTFRDLAKRGPEERALMRSIMLEAQPQGLAELIQGVLGARLPVQERALELIDVPTAVVVGAGDEQCREPSVELARRITGATFGIVEGVGHMSPVEDSRQFNRLLQEFLDAGGFAEGDRR